MRAQSKDIKIEWKYTYDGEIKRVANTLAYINNGFFRVNNFYLRYYDPIETKYSAGVVIPNITYLKLPRFWQKVALTTGNVAEVEVEAKLYKFLETELRGLETKPYYEDVRNVFEVNSRHILHTVLKVLLLPDDHVKSIKLMPSKYGTGTSYNPFDEKKGELIILFREGVTIGNIVATIVNALTRNKAYSLSASWTELRFLVDWIMNTPSVKELLKEIGHGEEYKGALVKLRSSSRGIDAKSSTKIYKDIGLAENLVKFAVKDGSIYSNNRKIKYLTKNELKVLQELITKDNKIVTYDKLGEVLFDHPDSFSLEAITKTIQRVRDKLEKNNISSTYIQTVSKKGYILAV